MKASEVEALVLGMAPVIKQFVAAAVAASSQQTAPEPSKELVELVAKVGQSETAVREFTEAVREIRAEGDRRAEELSVKSADAMREVLGIVQGMKAERDTEKAAAAAKAESEAHMKAFADMLAAEFEAADVS